MIFAIGLLCYFSMGFLLLCIAYQMSEDDDDKDGMMRGAGFAISLWPILLIGIFIWKFSEMIVKRINK